jgi:hypothetical protein
MPSAKSASYYQIDKLEVKCLIYFDQIGVIKNRSRQYYFGRGDLTIANRAIWVFSEDR